ncbi:hypothetical protein Rhopal_000187-T1 [Rhodotorula paludigena]|uniref:GST N-terminal domain-containing protein n=1 Tax=Rhodotorula paludigena TaxID=86838 RepID=A0AAV5GD46_9BASI|nr:hypothetical protein Rhopal_000187-T1 [Rhodotorula paludigena]
MAAAPSRLIFYDLVGHHGGPFYSPNTWKTRLSLLAKGVEFDEREVTYLELREMAPRIGVERPAVPLLEFPDGTFLSDSWAIAEWLDKTYPDQPSLFLPDAPTPVQLDSPEMTLAKNYALLFSGGFGDSDSMWSTFYELSAQGICDSMTDPMQKEYFTSDYKQGFKDAWKWLQSRDRVLPLNPVLAKTPFLSGHQPGFVDFIAYGRYHMMRSACPADCKAVWFRPDEIPHVGAWIERIGKRWEKELEGAMARLPPM